MIWNVLFTRPRSEKKVFERLSDLGIEAYCPCQRILKKWSDRKKWIEEPVFRSYLFVKAPNSESQKLEILQTPGVLKFLHWLGKAAQVRQSEIDAIRGFLGEHQCVESISFDVGAKLNVEQGVLKGSEGLVIYQTKHEVVLRIQKFGMSLVARLPKISVSNSNL